MTGAVCICGVWHKAQPISEKWLFPFCALSLGFGSGDWPVGKAHQNLKLLPIRQDVEWVVKLLILDVGVVGAHHVIRFGFVWTLAVRVFLRRGREGFVGDSHLDVVGFAGKDRDGFVLRLPSKTGDGAVVAAAVGMAGDAKRRSQVSGSIMLRQNLAILD